MKTLLTTIFICLILSGCSKLPDEGLESDQYRNVKLDVNSFNSTSGSESLDVSSLNAFLFSDGTLSEKYNNLSINGNLFNLPLSYLQSSDVNLYFIANTESVSAGINKYILADRPDYISANADKDMIFLTAKKIRFTKIPLGGKFNLSNLSSNAEINVNMTYAMARVDLQIDETRVEIDSMVLNNLSTGGYLVEPAKPYTTHIGELFNHTESFSKPITASQTVGYINPQYNNNSLTVKIYGKFNGIKVQLLSNLPPNIERNNVYTIRLIKVGATLTANITVSDWNNGGSTDATPDVDARVLIDAIRSEFGPDVSYSTSYDTLFVPSNRNSNIILALDAQYELDATAAGNTADISIEAADGFNRFRLKVNGQSPGSPAYYSYIMLRNKFFEDNYGERVVLAVAPNKDYLIADIATLASISGIDVVGGLATVSEYGTTDITIPANKIRVDSDLFTTIQGFEDVSTIGADYKAISMSKNGNNIILKSVANTTDLPQSAMAIVRGVSADGKKIAAAISITIPPVSKSEVDALNSLCVEMGGNTWMQFNTTGAFATDIQIAKQITALPSAVTVDNIKANFSIFGRFSDTYNKVPSCPPGFRTPTQQEYCNLFGVANTSSLSLLNTVATGSVTTTGGMSISYNGFSTANRGQALVTISKDGRIVYLTNGRFATNPARGFFEFWHPGSFTIGTAATSSYNWAGRCVKITSYKGLN